MSTEPCIPGNCIFMMFSKAFSGLGRSRMGFFSAKKTSLDFSDMSHTNKYRFLVFWEDYPQKTSFLRQGKGRTSMLLGNLFNFNPAQ